MADPRLLLELHARAARRFDEIVDRIPDDTWDDVTPCSEWSVRDLLVHMIEEARWAPHLLHGLTLDEAGDLVRSEPYGDPKADFHRANAGELAAAVPTAFEHPIHTSAGRVPAEEYLFQRLCDLTVHGWDMAVAIGIEAELDPEGVSYCYQRARPREDDMKRSGLFGERIEPSDDADELTRLLAVFGREPEWSTPSAQHLTGAAPGVQQDESHSQ